MTMEVRTTSVQFSAAYGSKTVCTNPGRTDRVDRPNAQNTDLLTHEDTENGLWGVSLSGNMSGSVSVRGGNSWAYAAFSVSVSFHPDTYQDGELGSTIDMLAASFAAIRNVFSGETGDNPLDELLSRYETRKKETADSFSDMVSNFLEATHPTGQEKSNVRQSIYALFASAEAKYQNMAAKNSQESWMGESLSVTVANLRRMGASVQTDGSSVYSLQELEFAAAKVCRGYSLTA